VLHGEAHGLKLGVNPQLRQQVPDVGLDGLGADEELVGDALNMLSISTTSG
jgi:hypothetical protein